jgi:hypothetical protein
MKKIIIAILCCFTVSLSQKRIEERTIPAFEFKPNDLELSRLAQPTQYFDKIGPRAGLSDCESKQFEIPRRHKEEINNIRENL